MPQSAGTPKAIPASACWTFCRDLQQPQPPSAPSCLCPLPSVPTPHMSAVNPRHVQISILESASLGTSPEPSLFCSSASGGWKSHGTPQRTPQRLSLRARVKRTYLLCLSLQGHSPHRDLENFGDSSDTSAGARAYKWHCYWGRRAQGTREEKAGDPAAAGGQGVISACPELKSPSSLAGLSCLQVAFPLYTPTFLAAAVNDPERSPTGFSKEDNPSQVLGRGGGKNQQSQALSSRPDPQLDLTQHLSQCQTEMNHRPALPARL